MGKKVLNKKKISCSRQKLDSISTAAFSHENSFWHGFSTLITLSLHNVILHLSLYVLCKRECVCVLRFCDVRTYASYLKYI